MNLPLTTTNPANGGSNNSNSSSSNNNNNNGCTSMNLKLLGAAALCFITGGTHFLRASSIYSMNGATIAMSELIMKKSKPTEPVKHLILLGERHSGTNWITDHLVECFNEDIKVTDQYKRWKHGFQEEDLNKISQGSAVVIVMFRDPYNWIEAMRVEPHHSHDHVDWPNTNKKIDYSVGWRQQGAKPLHWKEFVTKPWIGKRGPSDANMSRTQEGMKNAKCMDDYSYWDAAPCSLQDAPVVVGLGEYKYEYQHDGSERGFSSIVHLRREKIKNHLSIADFLGTRALFPFRFEDLNVNGTASLLKSVEDATGLKAKCNATLGKARARRLNKKPIIKHRELPEDYIQWMNRFVDWEVESQIGYFKRG